jgi:hypothetical protein
MPTERIRAVGLAVACLLCPVSGLAGQSSRTMAETKAWLETDAATLAISSSEMDLTNVRMVAYTASAVFLLNDCQLSITVTDNSGVSGFQVTTLVTLKDVDAGGVRVVTRPEGYHDFVYIPGRTFVTIPARDPNAWPFRTITSRGELRAYVTTIPAKDPDAGATLAAAVEHAAVLCGAPAAAR